MGNEEKEPGTGEEGSNFRLPQNIKDQRIREFTGDGDPDRYMYRDARPTLGQRIKRGLQVIFNRADRQN